MTITDADAWVKYRHHRNFFNKLWLAEQMGYKCGPAGVPIPDDMKMVITRPIFNLSGMGVGTVIHRRVRYEHMTGLSPVIVPAGHFWCEMFEGQQTSTTYQWRDDAWVPVSRYIAVDPLNFRTVDGAREQRVQMWIKDHSDVGGLNAWFDRLADVGTLNIERVGMNIIEVHLRGTPDPDFETLIPIFKGDETRIPEMCSRGYQFVYAPDDADGLLRAPRIGFACSNQMVEPPPTIATAATGALIIP